MTTIGISYPKEYLGNLLKPNIARSAHPSMDIRHILGLAFRYDAVNPFNLQISQFALVRTNRTPETALFQSISRQEITLVQLPWFSSENQRLHDYTNETIYSPPLLEEARGDLHQLEFIENTEEQQRVRVRYDAATERSEVSIIEIEERQVVPKKNNTIDAALPHLIFFSKEEIEALIEISESRILFSNILTRYGKMAIHEPLDKSLMIGLKMEADRLVYQGENVVSGGYNGIDCPPKWPEFLYGPLFSNILLADYGFYRNTLSFTPPVFHPIVDSIFNFIIDFDQRELDLRNRIGAQFKDILQDNSSSFKTAEKSLKDITKEQVTNN